MNINTSSTKIIKKAYQVSLADRITFWFTKGYLPIFNFILFLYIAIPTIAPVLMKADAYLPAKIIYRVYSPLCHQLGFRSFYLFGEQAYYPRSLAGIPDLVTYEELTGTQNINIIDARNYLGDEIHGYKIAICERCLAIYGAMLVFGLIFEWTGRKIKPLPWYLWIIFGLLPLGLDGVSQLPGLVTSILPDWLPARESTPVLRVLTGVLFGITTVWYLYPFIEESMQETREIYSRKVIITEGASDIGEVDTHAV